MFDGNSANISIRGKYEHNIASGRGGGVYFNEIHDSNISANFNDNNARMGGELFTLMQVILLLSLIPLS